jgi:hypothetical protein
MEYKKYEKQGFYAGQPLRASQLETIEEGIIEAQELAAQGSSGGIDKLNLKNGEGENSIQLPLEGETFTYTGSDKITHTYSNETTGSYSTNLSPQSKVEREYSLNVGYQNTLEFRNGETAGYTDGGAIIGYRNYSNSSSSFLTGA